MKSRYCLPRHWMAEIRGSEAADSAGEPESVFSVAESKGSKRGRKWEVCGQAVQSTQPTVARQCMMQKKKKKERICSSVLHRRSLHNPSASTAEFKPFFMAWCLHSYWWSLRAELLLLLWHIQVWSPPPCCHMFAYTKGQRPPPPPPPPPSPPPSGLALPRLASGTNGEQSTSGTKHLPLVLCIGRWSHPDQHGVPTCDPTALAEGFQTLCACLSSIQRPL